MSGTRPSVTMRPRAVRDATSSRRRQGETFNPPWFDDVVIPAADLPPVSFQLELINEGEQHEFFRTDLGGDKVFVDGPAMAPLSP